MLLTLSSMSSSYINLRVFGEAAKGLLELRFGIQYLTRYLIAKVTAQPNISHYHYCTLGLAFLGLRRLRFLPPSF